MNRDITILRDLAQQYAAAAAQPVQNERRALWTRHNSRKQTRPLVLATFGMWNVWCRAVFADERMQCRDPFYCGYERALRMLLFQDRIGDDSILEPWITVRAAVQGGWGKAWGVQQAHTMPGVEGGAWKFDPPIKAWRDVQKLTAPAHVIDEEATQREASRLHEAIGDILPINISRGPLCQNFLADISTDIAQLRGLEQLMIDMYESPRELHALLAFMRDGIIANQAQAERAGDWGLADQHNQAVPYCEELTPPAANVANQPRKNLWYFCAAQEFTLISPAMHEEFMLRYQLPIISAFGLSAYGCCEDLTKKIDMLRQIPNLRIIAVTPRADVRRCAEQIGTDYVMSWRPNPTDMVCCGFDEALIRRTIREGLAACKGCHVHVHLKDVETVEGAPERLAKWARIVRDVADAC